MAAGGGRTFATIQGGSQITIARNRIHSEIGDTNYTSNGLIHMGISGAVTDVLIDGNVIRGVGGVQQLTGIRVSASSATNLRITNNTIESISYGVITTANGGNATLRSNAIANCTTPLTLKSGDLLENATNYEMTASPSTGTWRVGDRVWNSTPTVGQPIGWICTVAGSPGTWVALANL